jgi:hypothetical protein
VPEDGAVNVLGRFSKHLSDDGSLLVFESAGGASPVKTGEKIRDVFIYHLDTQTFTQVTTQDVGKRELSDFNYFPSLNGAGTFVAFSSKLNLPVTNDTAGNFNNSREVFRYAIAGSTPASPQFFLATQTEVSTDPADQRQILLAPFISDDGTLIAFSNHGHLLAARFNATPEVFQAALRPVIRESATQAVLANAASLDRTAIARGSLALVQNDDDEEDVFTDQTITASSTEPPLELAGIRVQVAGAHPGGVARPGEIHSPGGNRAFRRSTRCKMILAR